MQSAQSFVAISPCRPAIAVLFDLDDPDERFMIETMQRFHGEHPGLYRAHAMKRTRDGRGQRVVVEVASVHPRQSQGAATWMLILWNIDEVSISFLDQTNRQAALVRYRGMTDGIEDSSLARRASKPLVTNPS